jgi:hypothetical protein
MKNKKIYLDSKKFNLFLERMDSKMTLNESVEKDLLIEGWIDDLIRVAKTASINTLELLGKNLPAEVVNPLKRSFDDLIDSAKLIEDGISKNINDIKAIRNDIGPNAITTIKNNFDSLIKNVSNTISVNPKTKKVIDDFIKGDISDLGEEVLLSLNESQIDVIVTLRNTRLNALSNLNDLDDLIKYVSVIDDNPTVSDLFSVMYTSGDVKSLDEFKSDWSRLDDIAMREPDSKVGELWTATKNNLNGRPKNSEEAAEILLRDIKQNPVFVQSKAKLIKSIKEYLTGKIQLRLTELNQQAVKKGVMWDTSLVFVNKNGDLNIVVSPNKKVSLKVKKILKEDGIGYVRMTDGSDGKRGISAEDFDEILGKRLPSALKGESRRKIRVRAMWIIGSILGIAGGAYAVCLYRNTNFTDEQLRDMEIQDPDAFKKYKERGFLDVILNCGSDFVVYVTAKAEELAIEIFDTTIRPYLLIMQTKTEEYLNEKCGRPSDAKKVGGKWDKPCERCLDCDKDISDLTPDLGDYYKEKVSSIDFKKLLLTQGEKFGVTEDNVNELVNKILGDADNGIISDMLTKDGKPMTIETMVKTICVQHSLECSIKLTEKTINEFYNNASDFASDCNGLENHYNEKLNLLRGLNEKGLLGWKEENKVDLSQIKEQHPDSFVATNDVSGIFWVLESDRDIAVNSCVRDYDSNTVEELGDFSIDVSNMMDDLWDQGLLKYDCDADELLTKNKMIMKINFTSLIRNLETDEVYGSLIDEIDTSSDYWDNELEEWWKKNREVCGITD